jgi:hypothetical protein
MGPVEQPVFFKGNDLYHILKEPSGRAAFVVGWCIWKQML